MRTGVKFLAAGIVVVALVQSAAILTRSRGKTLPVARLALLPHLSHHITARARVLGGGPTTWGARSVGGVATRRYGLEHLKQLYSAGIVIEVFAIGVPKNTKYHDKNKSGRATEESGRLSIRL